MCNILPRDGQSDGRRFTALFCWCRRNHPQESNCWREGWPAGCVCQISVRMWSMQVPSGARAAGSPRPLNQRPDPYVDITGADEKIPAAHNIDETSDEREMTQEFGRRCIPSDGS